MEPTTPPITAPIILPGFISCSVNEASVFENKGNDNPTQSPMESPIKRKSVFLLSIIVVYSKVIFTHFSVLRTTS